MVWRLMPRKDTPCAYTHISQTKEKLKEIKLRIKDSAFQTILDFIQLCPAAEVIGTGDNMDIKDNTDRSFACSVIELKARNVFITPADYAYMQPTMRCLPNHYSFSPLQSLSAIWSCWVLMIW